MNSACPTCKYSWAANGFKDSKSPVPITEDTDPMAVGVLHFCSEECRKLYIEENDLEEYKNGN